MELSIFCCLLVAVVARPLDFYIPGEVQILKYVNENTGIDGFNYEFEQSDGTKAQARGNLVKLIDNGKEVTALVIDGSYSFVNNGVTYTVRYVADQNGYRPTISVRTSEVADVPGLPGEPGVPKAPGTLNRISPLIYASLLGNG